MLPASNYQEDSIDTQSVNNSRSGVGRNQKRLTDYEILPQKELGTGSYGRVNLVRERATGELYAMKEMSKRFFIEHNCIENLKREIKIHRRLRHPHITKLLNYFEDSTKVYLILEYAENGSLFKYIQSTKRLSEKETFVYFFQTCLGIDYLHKRNIIHRDLKPENLLLDSKGNVKVCDFGWSAEMVGDRYTFCGTLEYMAPEILKHKAYTKSVDIWSLGVLLFELLHGRSPYEGRTAADVERKIVSGEKIMFSSSISEDVKHLITCILQYEPSARLTMEGIFNHEWMKKNEKLHGIKLDTFIYKVKSKPVDEPPRNYANYDLDSQNIDYTTKEQGIKINDYIKMGAKKPPIPNSKGLPYLNSASYDIYDNKTSFDIDYGQYKQGDSYPYKFPNSPPSNLNNLAWNANKNSNSLNYSTSYGEPNQGYSALDRKSRLSGTIIENPKPKKEKEETGFFKSILEKIGCISREKPGYKYSK